MLKKREIITCNKILEKSKLSLKIRLNIYFHFCLEKIRLNIYFHFCIEKIRLNIYFHFCIEKIRLNMYIFSLLHRENQTKLTTSLTNPIVDGGVEKRYNSSKKFVFFEKTSLFEIQ